jgi:Fibronectin type III domain
MYRDRRLHLVRLLLACLAMMLLVGGGASVASATFRSTSGGSTSVKTDVVAPPTNLAAAVACNRRSVVFTWTASAWARTDGYELRFTANGTPQTPLPVAGRSTTTISYPLSKGVTYVFTLASTSPSSWSSITNPTLPSLSC